MNTTILEHVEWDECALRREALPVELYRTVRQAFGFVPEFLDYFAAVPWLVRSVIRLDPSQSGLQHTDLALAEMIALVVSQDNSCRYCYATHRTFLKVTGFPEDDIQRLEHEFLTTQFGAGRKLPLEFARRVSRADPPPSAAERAALLEDGWHPDAVKEIAYIAALFVYFNRIVTLPAIPYAPAEASGGKWWLRYGRPLVAWWIRSHARAPVPGPLPPELRRGPFAEIVLALDGLSIARALRAVLDDAWRSPALPARAKALVFAVVARAIGSPAAEREAVRLLGAEGLDEAAVRSILAHLGSPALDRLEAQIVPYARDTVRYDPAQIQRRGKALRSQLSAEQFIELVGTVALANAVSRLGATLVDNA
jgi:AhpD family alkylhydroperoxidase